MCLDEVLDMTIDLKLNEKEALIEILSKRVAEEKRKEISLYYQQVKQEFADGNLKSQTLEKIVEELEEELANQLG